MKFTVTDKRVLRCDECGTETSARYRIETKTHCQLDLCPKCFGLLLRTITNFVSEML